MNKMAKRASLLAVAFIVSIPLGLKAQDEGFYPYSFARLSYVNGTVYVQRASDLGYEQGEINLALIQGDKMGTESGQAEIHFGRRNYLRLDDNTKVEFALLPSEGDERIRLILTEGSAYLRVSHLAVDKGIEVHTPDASFYVLEEGLFRIDVRLDRETRASVREGSLEAAAESGSVLVRDKESVTAVDGRLLGDPEYDYSREDGFDTWNGSRDALLAARSGRRYLPSELEEYEEELEENGHWVYERPYGNVWVPNVSYADWRPYLYGRWVWYPVVGWTWVSSESWGWSVYHYGRWHWRFGLGWYWIPRHHWGPAWVHWWWDGGHVGWCPLSWYNRPIVIVNNRFYDRHYDRYFPAQNRAMTVIRRGELQARHLDRRQLGVADRDRIGRVELKRDQPALRPVVDNARPQAIAAKRALEPRSGVRNDVRRVAPSSSLSPSRLRPQRTDPVDRARGRDASVERADRGAAARPSLRPSSGRDPASESRVVRPYPSRRDASPDRAEPAVNRRDPGSSSVRRSEGASSDSPPARVSRSGGQESKPSQPRTVREPQKSATSGKGAGNSSAVKRETVKKYPSSDRSVSTPGTSKSRAYSSSPSVSRTPSGPGSSSSSASRSSASVARASSSARSGAPSYSQPSRSRTTSSSRPRTSAVTPSRSSGSSGRSIGPSRPSSSGRSIGAPRSSGSSSGRASGAPRSGGSSLGRSSSSSSRSSGSSGSGRSGSSSSRSSASSSKSGSVKRKG